MNAPATPPISYAELAAEAAACRAMWCALVERLLLDAAYDGADGEAAREWLRRPDPVVLDFCGLSPAAAIPRLRRMAA